MAASFELKIHQLFLEHNDFERVADQLIRQWNQSKFSEEEEKELLNFLFNTGLYPSILEKISFSLEKEKDFSWQNYLMLINEIDSSLDESVAEALVSGLQESNQKFSIYFTEDSVLNETFSELRVSSDDLRNGFEQHYETRKSELKDRLHFLRSQRLFEEEKKTLQLIEKLSPSEKMLSHSDWADYNERWANHVLAEKNVKKNVATERKTQKVHRQWQKEMNTIVLPVVQSMQENLKESPELAEDFALGLRFMDFPQHSLDILENKNEKRAKACSQDWLVADLLFESRRFVDLLSWLKLLEEKYSDDTETAFASSFLKSQALWELGEQTLALDILRGILKIRPNYRFAHTLFQEWTEGER